jgi:hypothetical protein
VNEKKSKKVITSMAVRNKETSKSGWFIAVAPVAEGDAKSNFSSSPEHGNVIIF